jgi:hypothetical protein
LVVAWLTACLLPDGPFPVLVLLGEQGSAKSTTAKVLRSLIDPNKVPVRSLPKDLRDLMIQSRGNWVMSFDNVSRLPDWLSDAVCCLSTGGGFGVRQLYTDEDEVVFEATRPVIVNGIEDFVTRADLLERSLLIRHPPIGEDDRRPESELLAAFETARPKLLGAILDRVVAGLRTIEAGFMLDQLPRMADFALFAAACEHGTEGETPIFLDAYKLNQAVGHEQALDNSPIPQAVVKMMTDRASWEGTPSVLLEQLTFHASEPLPRNWPRMANALTNHLRRSAPSLRRVHGLDVEVGRSPGGNRTRFIRITRLPDMAQESPSSPPPSSQKLEGKIEAMEVERVLPGPFLGVEDTSLNGKKPPDSVLDRQMGDGRDGWDDPSAEFSDDDWAESSDDDTDFPFGWNNPDDPDGQRLPSDFAEEEQ